MAVTSALVARPFAARKVDQLSRCILVTGAAGFAGSRIARAVLERGDRVVGLDIAPRLPSFVTDGLGDASLNYMVGDVIGSHHIVAAVLDASVEDIVHTAAAMGDADSIQRPRHFLRQHRSRLEPVRHRASTTNPATGRMSRRSIYGAYAPQEGSVAEDAAPDRSTSTAPPRRPLTSWRCNIDSNASWDL